MEIIFFAIVALAYLSVVVYQANRDDVIGGQLVKRTQQATANMNITEVASRNLGATDDDLASQPKMIRGGRETLMMWMLYAVVFITFLLGLLIFLGAILPDDAQSDDPSLVFQVERLPATINFVLTLLFVIVSISVMRSRAVRVRLRRMLESDALYNPDSRVHTAAIVLSFVALSMTLSTFVISGGLSGLAENVAETEIAVDGLVVQMILEVAAAFVGIRFLLQRGFLQSVRRLGLRLPTPDDMTWGVGGGIGLFIFLIVVGGIWQALVSPEVFDAQTAASQEIANAINTLPLAFAVAMSAAVGEEIFFRGALQPVFGVVPVAIFFTLLHTQYTLTPATLIIFSVAVGLGLLRKKYSTTTAIIAHFLYNYIQLVIPLLAVSREIAP